MDYEAWENARCGLYLRVGDACMIEAAHRFAMALRPAGVLDGRAQLMASLVAVFLFGAVAGALGLYGANLCAPVPYAAARKVWMSWAGTVLILLTFATLTHAGDAYSRVVTLAWFLVAPWFVLLFRYAARAIGGDRRPSARGSLLS